MILKKCDKCGEIVDITNATDDEVGEANISVKMNEEGWNYRNLHLCKDCTQKLIEWISISRKE